MIFTQTRIQVTIHNINDPKFSRKPTPVSLRDGVEITRINGPDGFITNPNLQAFGSQRQSAVNTDDLNNSASSEFGGMFTNAINSHRFGSINSLDWFSKNM